MEIHKTWQQSLHRLIVAGSRSLCAVPALSWAAEALSCYCGGWTHPPPMAHQTGPPSAKCLLGLPGASWGFAGPGVEAARRPASSAAWARPKASWSPPAISGGLLGPPGASGGLHSKPRGPCRASWGFPIRLRQEPETRATMAPRGVRMADSSRD